MSVFISGDNVHAIVADIGGSTSKIGFAGEDHPRAYFRSNVAILREEEGEASSKDSNNNNKNKKKKSKKRRHHIDKVHYDSFSRPLAGEDDGNWQVGNPVDPTTGLWYDSQKDDNNYYNNNSADWADLIPIFLRHGYQSSLGLEGDTSGNPLLLVEKSYNPPPIRQQLLEILMEECQVPATFFGRDATLACYACGRTTSTVIDIGYTGTTVTPVVDGYVEQKGIRRSPVGSLAMDELSLKHLQSLVMKEKEILPLYQVRNPKVKRRHEAFHRLTLLEIAKDCREIGAMQSINTAASKSLQVPSIPYELPSGQMVDVPSQFRFGVADFAVGGAASGEDDAHASHREEALKALKEDYQALLTKVTNNDDAMEEDDDDEDDEEEEDKKQQQSAKYNEATAVGVSSRRTTRGSRAVAKEEEEKQLQLQKEKMQQQQKKNRVEFDNRILQTACLPYLQAFEQQLTAAPIANMVCDAAFGCNRDQQASLLGNVVLAGGGACIGPTDQAVPDMLRDQIEAIIHTHTPGWRVKVLSPAMQERSICSWLGGSILGSLGSFHEMWITKAEYEEWGSAIINRKCP